MWRRLETPLTKRHLYRIYVTRYKMNSRDRFVWIWPAPAAPWSTRSLNYVRRLIEADFRPSLGYGNKRGRRAARPHTFIDLSDLFYRRPFFLHRSIFTASDEPVR
ncbi:hypothetical protein EVAR_92447_1 [Eumeta japonica]|uniref:Uncharacterized protein n=1 Tax=Eumeta variegata TaxID=151549 RepID=A0A4C1T5Z3_EUMVA|nr:hypothetical protein EVAR_92447_1 [Eumeta japonica]